MIARLGVPGALLVATAFAIASAGAGAETSTVRVAVKPVTVKPGQALLVTAAVRPPRTACVATITRPGAPAAKLARKRAAGKVSWRWPVPRAAKPGRGAAKVTCSGAGSGSAGFRIASAATTPPSPPPPPPAPPPADADVVAGKAVFLANCGVCHTLRDAGTTGAVGPNLDGLRPSYAQVVRQVTNGGLAMPSFRGALTEIQIRDVAAYVATVAGR